MGPGWDALVDERFGRAAGFSLIEEKADGDSIEYLDNKQNTEAMQGAGIQAGEAMVKAGAEVLLTGHVGPKALRVLRAGKVQIFLGTRGTTRMALEDYRKGRLRPVESADVEGLG